MMCISMTQKSNLINNPKFHDLVHAVQHKLEAAIRQIPNPYVWASVAFIQHWSTTEVYFKKVEPFADIRTRVRAEMYLCEAQSELR